MFPGAPAADDLPLADRRAWPGLQTIADREDALLAPYAMKSAESRGRRHPDRDHAYRGPYQRDRDRILHSAAFRRLSGKTQVFTGDLGDYHRTRLTHTMEVSCIARTIGRALRLNEDLVEALALLHDLGHPPFGHAGEDTLDEQLAAAGGFSHNRYALTIVEELEERYPEFPGLNLTLEVLEGQSTRILKDNAAAVQPLWEVQVVETADSMTYDSHDIDDAVKLGLVSLDDLLDCRLVREAHDRVRRRATLDDDEMLRKAIVHELVDWQVSDLLRRCGEWLAREAPGSAEAARRCGFVIGPGDEVAELKLELEAFLYERVYRHPELMRVRRQGQEQIAAMLTYFSDRPDLLPMKFRRQIEPHGPRRAAAHFIAGMTDRYCVQQFQRYVA